MAQSNLNSLSSLNRRLSDQKTIRKSQGRLTRNRTSTVFPQSEVQLTKTVMKRGAQRRKRFQMAFQMHQSRLKGQRAYQTKLSVCPLPVFHSQEARCSESPYPGH